MRGPLSLREREKAHARERERKSEKVKERNEREREKARARARARAREKERKSEREKESESERARARACACAHTREGTLPLCRSEASEATEAFGQIMCLSQTKYGSSVCCVWVRTDGVFCPGYSRGAGTGSRKWQRAKRLDFISLVATFTFTF